MKPNEAEKKGIELESLRKEQRKLAKAVQCKDIFDFNLAEKFLGIVSETNNKEIIASVVLLNENLEVLESKFAIKKANFPYIPGFRAYRELNVIIEAFEKLTEAPDVIFILGHGISHPRGLGIASHLGVSLQRPVIGIVKSLVTGVQEEDEIYLGKKVVAKKIETKENSKPIYVSPGNLISLKKAIDLTKKLTIAPHKLPEPLVQARKFANNVRKELTQ